MAAKNYGTIAIIPAGEWDNTKLYKVGRVVSYNGSSYLVHTLPPIGTLPTNIDYYQLSAQGGGTATDDSPGVVKSDNISIDVDTSVQSVLRKLQKPPLVLLHQAMAQKLTQKEK